jgi:cytochrome c oxidase cbb3-type subunit 1
MPSAKTNSGAKISSVQNAPGAGELVATTLRQHSLFWLVATNSVGVLLAAELLWPQFGDMLAPFTYGRWIPLHLDWSLYGWCALPLAGVLLHWIGYGPNDRSARAAHVALWAWSLALAAGGASWLSGLSSGKLFLDWHGWARPLMPTAMTLLWGVLGWQLWINRSRLSTNQLIKQGVVLLALFIVPPVIFRALQTNIYPSVNPKSGGATGTSLLGSTLGIVAILGVLPDFLRIRPSVAKIATLRITFWTLFALCCFGFILLDHANASSGMLAQQIGLGVLVIWIPIVWIYFRAFDWNAASRPWLEAVFVWWLLLVLTGFIIFLPAFSERLKFTNALVAHAHLAMAGLITSLNIAILNQLTTARALVKGFWPWQIATAVYFVALTVLGWIESINPGGLFRSEMLSQIFYGLRLAAGSAMLVVSVIWFLHRPPPASLFD